MRSKVTWRVSAPTCVWIFCRKDGKGHHYARLIDSVAEQQYPAATWSQGQALLHDKDSLPAGQQHAMVPRSRDMQSWGHSAPLSAALQTKPRPRTALQPVEMSLKCALLLAAFARGNTQAIPERLLPILMLYTWTYEMGHPCYTDLLA